MQLGYVKMDNEGKVCYRVYKITRRNHYYTHTKQGDSSQTLANTGPKDNCDITHAQPAHL